MYQLPKLVTNPCAGKEASSTILCALKEDYCTIPCMGKLAFCTIIWGGGKDILQSVLTRRLEEEWSRGNAHMPWGK